MMKNEDKVVDLRIIVLLDIMAIGLMYMIPTLSHWSRLPLYKFEPMRCVLLLNMLLTNERRNAFIMAVTLPLFSFIVGSHPVLIKALLMAFELSANVCLFDILTRRIKNDGLVMFISILLSKGLYYLVKYGLISIGLMNSSFFGTNLGTQLLVAAVISLLFVKHSWTNGNKA